MQRVAIFVALLVGMQCIAAETTNVVRRVKVEPAYALPYESIEVTVNAGTYTIASETPETTYDIAALIAYLAANSEMTQCDINTFLKAKYATEPGNAWYDRFSAPEGSYIYWILRCAREKAAKGESTDDLKLAFDKVIATWLSNNDDDK